MINSRVFLRVIIPLLLCSCAYDKDLPMEDCATTNSTFQNAVLPILQNTCAAASSCHGDGSINGPGPLTDYAKAKAASIAIRDAVHSRRMPQGSILPERQRQAIICWVNSGAPNN